MYYKKAHSGKSTQIINLNLSQLKINIMNLEDKLKSELQLFGTAQLKVNAITQKEIIKRYNAYEDLIQKSYNLIATLHEQLPYDSTQNEDIIFDVKELADLLNELKPELETQILELDEQ